ncbi:hypothetical protein ACFWH4_33825, partial [Streptomyces sp. NPDC127091]
MTLPAHRGRGSLSGWDPLQELEDLRIRVDQLMHASFPGRGFPEALGGVWAWAPLAVGVASES